MVVGRVTGVVGAAVVSVAVGIVGTVGRVVTVLPVVATVPVGGMVVVPAGVDWVGSTGAMQPGISTTMARIKNTAIAGRVRFFMAVRSFAEGFCLL
jgi:hypothetical protein